ncbi:hypothetical protein Syun_003511 [Stephania yunnanensis]|uniref:Uncharacterized protein n=1 Tax=Stephania yunnanensis TaxID=152371 RepID=A0AAP0Q1P0_9MAGN
MIPETQSRRSRGRPAAAEESGPSSGGGGAGPNQRWRRIAEATSGGEAEAGPSNAADGRTRRRPSLRRHKGPRSGQITGLRSPVDGQRRQIQIRGQRRWFEKRESGGGKQRRRRRRPHSGSGADGEYRSGSGAGQQPRSGRGARRLAVDGGCR